MSSLKTTHRWCVTPRNLELEQELVSQLSIAPLVARVMVAHGISSVSEGHLFLTPSLERDWADPLLIPGMREVADRVERAISSREPIVVFGDFDVDGITSTCLLTEALRALGAQAQPFIPRRFGEGYGISEAALDRMVATHDAALVITVDNGIAAREEVQYLLNRGIDVVVTDHHEPADLVPQGVPVADPKLAADGPSRELAGAGVALKLVHELGKRSGKPELWRAYTEVAALGTVSDMMPLTPENRALVADGIAHMRSTARHGYIALAALTRTDLSTVSADTLSFSLIPRLNAAGRMADPVLALDVLMATDAIEAGRLASELEKINQERRAIESELTVQAEQEVERTYDGGRVIVVGGEGWHEGVKGIVANRLVNRHHVPSLLFSIKDGIASGSGRSVGSINLFDMVEQCSDLLIRFGGHSGAVGVTCTAENLDPLRKRLGAILSQLPEEAFEDRGEIAATVELSELDVDTISQLKQLEPFGQGNSVPVFAATGVMMTDRATVGKTGDHLRFYATDGITSVPAIMFRAPQPDVLVSCDTVVDLVFEAVAECWQGRTKTKLMIKDILRHDSQEVTTNVSGPVNTSHNSAEDECIPCCMQVEQSSQGSRSESTIAATGNAIPPVDTSRRRLLERLPYDQLTTSLIHTFIHNASPHRAQVKALDALKQRKNVMAVMGTGRGKSLIFHVHAVREAILNNMASVFVYPLRALVSDQAFHLQQSLSKLGIQIEVLTGETQDQKRDQIFSRLAAGRVDIILTTPEFLAIHRNRFAVSRRIGFMVIDEAHHIAEAKGGSRSAYLDMPAVYSALGEPTVLALTATAPQDVTDEIRRLLPINTTIVDVAMRENLQIDDRRDLTSRENRLVSIVAQGEKCVVYVNSRDQAVALCRTLRHRIPQLAQGIAFYHAGLDRADRTMVEEAFRTGDLCCIIATSAFGEGVNLPDIRHVVLYHMPFGGIEFNQMSGRAGRDGATAQIHLLYSQRDARINERFLNTAAPEYEVLTTLYRALLTMSRSHAAQSNTQAFHATDPDIVQMCRAVDARIAIDDRAVASGLSIFEELGLAHINGFDAQRLLEIPENPAKVELTNSVRYLEGLHARLEFETFKQWALHTDPADMLSRLNRPITPQTDEAGY